MGVQLPDTATAATVPAADVPVKPDQATDPANNGVGLDGGDVKKAAVIDVDGAEKIKAKVADSDNNGVDKPDDAVTTADGDADAEQEKDAENGKAKDGDGEAAAKDDDDEADEDFAEDGENDDDDDDEVDDEDDDDDDDEDGEDDDGEEGDGGEGAKMGLTSEMVSQFLPKELIGSKALLAAAKDNDIDTITTLLEAEPEAGEDGEKIGKVDINAKDPYEYTALHLASEGGAVEVVKKLVEHKAGLELETRMHQCRPLHYAASNGHADIIQLLVDAGADINAVTDDGRTPLMQAAIQGHVECVKTLLRNKADASIKDAEGKTPAEKTEVREVIEALEGPPEKKARTE